MNTTRASATSRTEAAGGRIAPQAAGYPWYVRLILAAQRRKYGAELEPAILELTALVAFQNLSSKFNAALGVPAQGFCARPEAQESKR